MRTLLKVSRDLRSTDAAIHSLSRRFFTFQQRQFSLYSSSWRETTNQVWNLTREPAEKNK